MTPPPADPRPAMPPLRRTLPAVLLALRRLSRHRRRGTPPPTPTTCACCARARFALERGETAAAVRDLRLACFGFLEEPPPWPSA